MLKSFTLGFLFLCVGAWAELPQSFEERFQLNFENQELVSVSTKHTFSNFSLKSYLKGLKSLLQREKQKLLNESDYFSLAEEQLADLLWEEGERNNRYLKYYLQSLSKIGELDIEKIFSSPQLQKGIERIEKRINSAIKRLQLEVLAVPSDMSFFFKRKLTQEILRMGLRLAKQGLSDVPVVNLLTYLIAQAEKTIVDRRIFLQNALLYYLAKYTPEQLGVSQVEADRCFSSIYESRLAWLDFLSRRQMRADWDNYGVNRYYTGFRANSTNLSQHRDRYDFLGERLSYNFRQAVYKGQKVILNLENSQSSLQSWPAIAFYSEDPQKVLRQRVLIQLVQLGVRYLPVPGFLKNTLDGLLNSTYSSHILSEGALVAYFEDTQQMELARRIMAQNLNPFLR